MCISFGIGDSNFSDMLSWSFCVKSGGVGVGWIGERWENVIVIVRCIFIKVNIDIKYELGEDVGKEF